MKGTGAKRNVCPGSCVSTRAKFPVAPVESAPMCTMADGMMQLVQRTRRLEVGTPPPPTSLRGLLNSTADQQESVLTCTNGVSRNHVPVIVASDRP